jgi:4-methylaminobutanoate oxidase (formaldehyde-forming)
VTAEWMINGYMNEDLYSLDIKRFQKFHSSKKFIMNRVTETLGDLYGMHWPYKQHITSRDQKLLPYHKDLKNVGACFGQSGEYERPMWYALEGIKPEYDYSFNYQNWYPSVEHESKNTIKNVGLFELSPFSKYEIKGENAYEELQRLCTANIKNEIGRCTYTHMLNEEAGIETDLTVVCIDKNYFRIISSAAVRTHDKAHILKHLSKNVEFKDVTDDLICLGIFGPKSRDLLSKITKENLSNDNFRFATAKNINFKSNSVWTQRLSYVGELGYELYIKKEKAKEIYDLIISTGKGFGLTHCGAHTMDTMRMESGFLHWGHDISPEENQYQAGLSFTISYKKPFNFIGKEKLLKIKDQKLDRRFVMLVLKENIPGEPLLLHEEPIYLEDKIIGKTTSGNYSFNYNKNLSFGYINSEFNNEQFLDRNIYIEIEKKKYVAQLLLKPLKETNFKNI